MTPGQHSRFNHDIRYDCFDDSRVFITQNGSATYCWESVRTYGVRYNRQGIVLAKAHKRLTKAMSDKARLGTGLTRDDQPIRMAMVSMLIAAIDRFIPANLHNADNDLLRRARLTVTFSSSLLFLAVLFGTFHVLARSWICATALGLGACIGVGCLYIMRRTGSCTIVGNLSSADLFVVLTVLATRLGGHGCLTLAWYVVIPVVALMTAGRRSGFVWLVITSVSFSFFYGLQIAGYQFPNDLSLQETALLDFVSMIALVVLLLGLAFLHETSKNEALAELRDTEKRLSREKHISDSVIASLPGMFYLFDDEGNFLRWNENLMHVSGYSAEELSHMKPTDFFSSQDRELITRRISDVLAMGKPGTEASFQPKNGPAIPYLFSARPVMIDGKTHLAGTGLDITERKRIEEALQASEERFRQFAVASGSGLAMIELEGRLVFANAATLRMLEEESEEALLSKPYRDYYCPDDAERIEREVLPAVLKDGQWAGEITLVSAKGKVIPTEQSVFLIHDEQGEPRMMGSIITDITERKRAEAALEKRIVALTRPLDDAEDLMLEELFNLEDIQRLQDEFAKATGVASIITRPDGTPITTPSSFCRLCSDIIRKSEKGLANCFKSDAALGRFNPDGPIVQTCMSGGLWDAGASISVGGKHIANWLIGQVRDCTQTEEGMREYARNIGVDEEEVVEAFREVPTMSRGQFENVAQALFTIAQQLSTTAYQNVQQARFITERKRSEAELAVARDEAQAANQAKSEFLANMSHEIRTPMTAILGFAEILMGSDLEREQADAATTVKHNGEYLLRIINDILDLSKIEAGKMQIERIQCSPCQILSDVTFLMRIRADAKNLPLVVEYDGPMPKAIQSDPIRLRQILMNLISNAIKFTEVGEIRIVARVLEADSESPRLQIEVIDSGIGIPEKEMDKLFKPFGQIDSSTTRQHGGTGLGLVISKRLAERLGGDIRVRSTVGKGCNFTLTVKTGPLDAGDLLEEPSRVHVLADVPRKVDPSNTVLDCRVLLAEDGPDNQRLVSFLLRKAGGEVVVADNGQIAFDLALAARDDGNPYDVILMDMQMPVLDGYDATRRLRKSGYEGPIIALTAHAMNSDREKCLQSGCDDYMAKPIDREKLILLVAEYASRNAPTAEPG